MGPPAVVTAVLTTTAWRQQGARRRETAPPPRSCLFSQCFSFSSLRSLSLPLCSHSRRQQQLPIPPLSSLPYSPSLLLLPPSISRVSPLFSPSNFVNVRTNLTHRIQICIQIQTLKKNSKTNSTLTP
ncbi:hypothetical protein AAHE18_09G071900 [Arachis hypogaea]